MHALWSCPKLNDTWKVHFGQLKADTVHCTSFLKVIDRALLVTTSFGLFAMVVSAIWMWHNKVHLGEMALPLGQIPSSTYDAFQEFQQLRPTHATISRTARAVRWRLPPETCVKVNFDGAVFSRDGLAGIGIIIRNEQGLVMAALSQQIPLPTSVEMVEVLAACRALVFAKELGFDRVIVEGDSTNTITSINGGHMDHLALGHVLLDIKRLFSCFSHISVKYINREGNCVAHKLARRATNYPFLVWMESVSPDILEVYQLDLLRMQ
ncbi:uncharacterized protein LOC115964767 [Quercus lobata]|uniref:uncharacterized protein LOC115964767 n=1 Tax=Quercus lobata TaxID=97700 RepID=UPI0012492EA1|nr:uncharacterized protein LOC115964767 [Quercus lobata]